MCTCSKQHRLHWMWLQNVSFYICGFTFRSVVIKGQDTWTWKDYVHNCAWTNWIDSSLVMIHVGLWCMLCRQSFKAIIILICNQRSQDEQMGCLYRHWKKCQLEYDFASNILRYLFLLSNNRVVLSFSFIMIGI
jgi:hypothetical protein